MGGFLVFGPAEKQRRISVAMKNETKHFLEAAKCRDWKLESLIMCL